MKKSTNHIAWNVMIPMTTNCTSARMLFSTIVDHAVRKERHSISSDVYVAYKLREISICAVFGFSRSYVYTYTYNTYTYIILNSRTVIYLKL